MEIKDELKGEFRRKMGEKYRIQDGYKVLQGVLEKTYWHKQVWNKLSVPKYNFILWLAVQNRLSTKDRMLRFNLTQDDICVLCCTSVETVKHLYFECPFSKYCLQQVKLWLGWRTSKGDIMELIRWLQRTKEHSKRLCFTAGLTTLVYWIWASRNSIIWREDHMATEEVIRRVKKGVRERLLVMGNCTKDMGYVRELLTCSCN